MEETLEALKVMLTEYLDNSVQLGIGAAIKLEEMYGKNEPVVHSMIELRNYFDSERILHLYDIFRYREAFIPEELLLECANEVLENVLEQTVA